MWLFPNLPVVIRGAGDLASGVAYRLFKAGFPVMMLERPHPLFVRRTVSFGNAIFEGGRYEVEGIPSVLLDQFTRFPTDSVGIFIDEAGEILPTIKPMVVVDARMQKSPLDTRLTDAPLVIGMGPGYSAGEHCHAVIETNRGHRLGRVIWQGTAEPDTGTPGKVSGYAAERVLRAPIAGYVIPADGIAIGSHVEQNQRIATIEQYEIRAPFPGMIRGLMHPSVWAEKNIKIGDIDPRDDLSYCYTISDKALAIGGGVLEAILSAPNIRKILPTLESHAAL